MRKVILGLAVSLDGYIEGPNGEYDWCFTDQDYGMAAFFQRVDSVFYGRKSYELVQTAPGGTGWMPNLMTYVFSNTLKEVPDGAILVHGDLTARVNEIKKEKGKDIWLFGGASLASSMINASLVDEFWLSIHPVLLGSGKPLFSSLRERIGLKLANCKTYNTGLVSLTYERLASRV